MNLSALAGDIAQGVSLRPYCTLRAGGRAEWFFDARDLDSLAEAGLWAQESGIKTTTLGWGSNILPSDEGVPGLVLFNNVRGIRIQRDGFVEVDCGAGFQDLFLKTVQAGLKGLEFAVGIPGTVGGALVSNAGAYRSNVSEFLTEIEVVADGQRKWVDPSWMEFQYRDSKLRQVNPPPCVLLRARMKLETGHSKSSYDEARDYQRQRIGKQPAPASAGSFFKNVYNQALADSLTTIPERIRSAGVVPAGYLLEHVGMMGHRLGGAMFARRHANFMLNVGGATAQEIYELAQLGKAQVRDAFGVELEEEVLYLGAWPHLKSA